MLRKMYSCVGLLLLAGAVLFATPGFSWARGGHFGGGHFGGGHFGGYHGGFYRGGYHYGHHPYYHYGSYGYYPYYSDYYPYYNDAYPYVAGPADNSVYYGSDGVLTPPGVNGYTSVTPPITGNPVDFSLAPGTDQPDAGAHTTTGLDQPDTMAHVTIQVPANAHVWFDDTPTTSTGTTRSFESPPLTPGQRYNYEIRAHWNQNGHEVTQTKQVEVTAGSHVNVDFAVPPKTAAQASTASKS